MEKVYQLVLSLLIISSSISFGQKRFMKLGDVSDEEISMSLYPLDSNASGVVLGDFGVSEFRFTENRAYVDFSRHVRIKIFDKEAFDKANFMVKLYKSTSGINENLTSVKGFVFNKVDGKLEKTKLKNDNIFTDEYDKNNDIVKITMPNVKEGSIIDLEYKISSPFLFNLSSWNFQTDIPTIRSEYHVAMIEYYNYKNWMEGYISIAKDEDKRRQKFSYMQTATIDPGVNGGRTSGGLVDFEADVTYWSYYAKDVPAFKDEPYLSNYSDYISSVHFELQTVNYPWAPVKNYTSTWDGINKTLNEDSDFGLCIKNDGHLKDIIQRNDFSSMSDIQKAEVAYNEIKKSIVWNGLYRIEATQSLRKTFNDKNGASSDINLNLVALCKNIGLEAYPVLVSTRRNGKVRPLQAILTQFNHVIAAVKIDDHYILMDAIDSFVPFGMLPPNTLNGQGRLVDEKSGAWINLYSSKKAKEAIFANLKLNEDFTIEGEVSFSASDYSALRLRNLYRKESSEEKFIESFQNEFDNFEFTDYKIEDVDDITKPLKISGNINLKDGVSSVGDLIFLAPKLFEKEEQVFKRETREYPIDFNYPIMNQVVITLEIPDGYTVDETPEPLKVALPDGKGVYLYMLNVLGNKIQLTVQKKINETVFPGVNYSEIKQFFDMIVAKEAENITIKKTL